jgi:hypothetical protein
MSSGGVKTYGTFMPDTISRRALNRALLQRQMLLDRFEMPVAEAVEWLIGMQAQVPSTPYTGLWSRLRNFDPMVLSDLIANRGAVRLNIMRATIHLVTARDCLRLRPIMQPVLERGFYTGSPFAKRIAGVDIPAVLKAGREFTEEAPRGGGELADHLSALFPGYDKESLGFAVQYLLPMVQIPPRGLWDKGGVPIRTTAQHWLGAELDASYPIETLVRRYLAAFGPASYFDMQAWSGLTNLREVFDAMRSTLRTFRSEAGRELFDLPDTPLPAEDVPAPVRFMPPYDNTGLAHDDRARIIAEEDRRFFNGTALNNGGLLVDGFSAAAWRIERVKKTTSLIIMPFAPLTKADTVAVEEEARRLLAFLAATDAHEVRFTERE